MADLNSELAKHGKHGKNRCMKIQLARSSFKKLSSIGLRKDGLIVNRRRH
jgi:hypothetical protein